MSDAKVTGTIDLAPRTTPLHGPLTLNGVAVTLASTSAAEVVGTINRFEALSGVTASLAAAASTDVVVEKSSTPSQYLVLSSPNDMNIGGDASVLSDLGLTGGVTKASSGVTAPSAVLVST